MAEASSPSQLNSKTSKHSKIELENLEWEIRKLSMVSAPTIGSQKVLLSSGQDNGNVFEASLGFTVSARPAWSPICI